MKYMGIDMGSKRIGIALSDAAQTFAFPHSIVPADGRVAEIVGEIVVREEVAVVVIGESRDRNNTHNAIHTAALALGEALKKKGTMVVYEWEGYSSAHARTLRNYVEGAPRGDVARKRSVKVPKKHVDDSAAALILQSYIDNRS